MFEQDYLNLTALAFPQGESNTLYSFAIDGTLLKEFATVSRIDRKDKTIFGYQRPEITSHINDIKKYLLSNNPLLPNSIVVAFEEVIEFIPFDTMSKSTPTAGILKIPINSSLPNYKKAAWIVDGQQRTAALFEANKENFYVCVVGFVAKNISEQREQFMLVNTTKPLSRGLLYELLPHVQCELPTFFEKRRFPAFLLEKLNFDPTSPLYKKIKMSTNREGIIQDNSILKMLENSIADGALYYLRETQKEKSEEDLTTIMIELLFNFWNAVSKTFQTAWSMPPSKSRLTHGAGIIALGFIMDAITDRNNGKFALDIDLFEKELEKLAPICRWTYGYWEFGPGAQRKWNEIQNTPTDIRILAHYLLLQYKSLVWNDAIRYS